MVDQQAAESKLGFVSHLMRICCRSHRAGRDGSETFPKTAIYCHLLPFWSRKTAKSVSTVSILFLPFEGVPASLGPGLRTVSGGQKELRWGVAIASILCIQMRRTKPFVRNQSVSGLATESPLR